MWEQITDWWYITSRELRIVKCNQHGWTYMVNDTGADHIECAFCHKRIFDSNPEFESIKQKVICWRFDEFSRPAPWIKDTIAEVMEIVQRNRAVVNEVGPSNYVGGQKVWHG